MPIPFTRTSATASPTPPWRRSSSGRAIALALAAQGADVAVNYAGSEAAAKEVAAEIEAMGRKAFVIQADIASTEASTAMVDAVVKEFGRIDVLVNNAGITRDGLIMRMSDEDFEKVIDVNLKGCFYMSREAAKIMMKQRFGKIVNISSVVGVMGNAGQTNYAASKAGVIGLTKSLAKELASRKINVNAIAPGMIETDMTNVLSDAVKEKMTEAIPFKAAGKAEDIANAVAFLASEESSYITGQVLCVDGGMVI